MLNKKLRSFIVLAVVIAAAGVYLAKIKQKGPSGEVTKEITPVIGSIRNLISATGTILPKNRLEIKPPVNGRIEKILVREGDKVKAGDILSLMSSTERAALLDAARGKGEKAQAYWEEAYKPIPLLASIDGEVIVATTQPGQTVTTADAVVVISDRLIVRAQVDETDIGKIKIGQQAVISLDAYPKTKIKGVVDHIYYESSTVNNVTIYKVDILPEEIPDFFRSGMNANVDFVVENKENVLLIPQEALTIENNKNYVLLKNGSDKDFIIRQVTLGISQEKSVEIVSGITKDDTLVVRSKKYALPKSSILGKNPFMPSRKQTATSNTTGSKKSSGGGGPPPM